MGYRSIDTAAFEQIAARLLAGETIELAFPNKRKALAFRHKFYTYRKMEQNLRNDPLWLASATVRLDDAGNVWLLPQPIDPELRAALGMEA